MAPELLQAAGYETICVQSNWTLKRKLSGLHRGFDVYEDDFHKKRWGFIKAERDGEEVTGTALKLLKQWDREKPLFAWFHYSDPHAPYKHHDRFDVAEDFKHEDHRIEDVTRDYDSEIAYMDHHIGRLLDRIPTENTYIVFIADHGESLWEHDYLGHGRQIYQMGLHIPFFIKGPGIEPGRSDAPVRGIDVGSTLLGLAGLDPTAGMLGLDILADPPRSPRVRVVETYGGAVPNIPGRKALMADSPPQRQGVLVDGWKMIIDGRDRELFNLRTDPMELDDLSLEEPDRVESLAALIEAWDQGTETIREPGAELTEDDREALEALGYIE